MRAGLAGAALAAALAATPAAAAQPSGPVPLHPVIYEADTLRTGPLPAELIQKMGPIHSLQGVEDLLKQNRVPFTWAHGSLDSGTLPTDLAKQMDALPPGEVFVVQQGQGWLMGVVTGKR